MFPGGNHFQYDGVSEIIITSMSIHQDSVTHSISCNESSISACVYTTDSNQNFNSIFSQREYWFIIIYKRIVAN